MTVEDVQRLGALDPCAVQIETDEKELLLLNDEDADQIREIVNKLQISDADILELFGLRPTDRDRAMKLFRGGHVVTRTVKFRSGHTRYHDIHA